MSSSGGIKKLSNCKGNSKSSQTQAGATCQWLRKVPSPYPMTTMTIHPNLKPYQIPEEILHIVLHRQPSLRVCFPCVLKVHLTYELLLEISPTHGACSDIGFSFRFVSLF